MFPVPQRLPRRPGMTPPFLPESQANSMPLRPPMAEPPMPLPGVAPGSPPPPVENLPAMPQNVPPPVQNLPNQGPPRELPPAPMDLPVKSRPMPPPDFFPGQEASPDPTMVTQRPEAPPLPGYQDWKDSQQDYKNIQSQRPKLEKPSIWNRLAGGVAGGIGGYMASSPSAVTRQNAGKLEQLSSRLLHPGHAEKMQEWKSDMDASEKRLGVYQDSVKTEQGLKDSESRRDYMQAQSDYQKELPRLARERNRANLITITPELAKDLDLPEDTIGSEVPSKIWEAYLKKAGFAAKNEADLKRLQEQIKSTEGIKTADRNAKVSEGAANRTSRENIASGSNAAKIAAATINANKPKGTTWGKPAKKSDGKYYLTYMDEDTKEPVVTDYETANPEKSGINWLLPNSKEDSKPGAAEAAKPAGTAGKPETKPETKPAAPKPSAKKPLTESQIQSYMTKHKRSRAEAIKAAETAGYDTAKIKK